MQRGGREGGEGRPPSDFGAGNPKEHARFRHKPKKIYVKREEIKKEASVGDLALDVPVAPSVNVKWTPSVCHFFSLLLSVHVWRSAVILCL